MVRVVALQQQQLQQQHLQQRRRSFCKGVRVACRGVVACRGGLVGGGAHILETCRPRPCSLLSRAVHPRFAGVERAYGAETYRRLADTTVVVVGVGGVGSWAAEALVRTGVGAVVLVDLDEVCVSNINRQLCATQGAVGKPKASVLAERFREVNPDVDVIPLLEFVDESNVDDIVTGAAWAHLGSGVVSSPPAVVLDAIDDVRNKARLIAACHNHGIRCVTCGGAGGALDPAASLRRGDLAVAGGDALLKATRRALKDNCGFVPPVTGNGAPWGIPAVYCVQTNTDKSRASAADEYGRACDKYGSAVCVTASMGFFAASAALEEVQRP